jgi:hypothetical protein
MRRLPPSFRSPLTAPPNLIEELRRELDETAADLVHLADRLSLLAELHQVAIEFALRLRRPVTLFDLLDAAHTPHERRRLRHLARRLRTDDTTWGFKDDS